MKFTKTMAATAAAAAAGSLGLVLGAPFAQADPNTQPFGSQGKLTDAAGNVQQHWTITNLKPSSDAIPYTPAGKLWEATATDEAVAGGVTPIVSNLNARSASGETYRVLFGVPTQQGVNPATLAQGQKTSGKVYFDVTGDKPDSVIYNAGGQDLLVWVGSPTSGGSQGGNWAPSPSRGGSGASSSSTAPTSPGATPTSPVPAPGAAPAGAEGVPAPAGTQTAPGAPLPAGSQGTPISADGSAAPAPSGSAGTPLPPGSNAGIPQPASVAGVPSQGVPSQNAPAAPAAGEGTQAAPAVAPNAAAAPTPSVVAPAPGR